MSEFTTRTEYARNWWIAPLIVLASIALVAVAVGGWFAVARAADGPVRAVHAEAQEDLQRIAVLHLAGEGALDLDASIDTYVQDVDSDVADLTVRDLLDATADLPGKVGLLNSHLIEESFGGSSDDSDLPSNAEAYALLEKVIDAVE